MWETGVLLIVISTFVLAGLVKGAVGLGLPTVSLALLTATLGLVEGMALMLVPSLVTNCWQALAGGRLRWILRRLWTFLAAASIGTWLFVGLIAKSDLSLLSALLGITLIAYAAFGLLSPALPPPGRKESWLSPVMGFATGALTGLTGSFTVPGVPYFQALAMPKDTLIQAFGVSFTVATLALGLSLRGANLIPVETGALSAVAVLPALAGMVLGRKIRGRLSEDAFRRALLAALGLLGAYIVLKSLF